jgi:hypothetical protein
MFTTGNAIVDAEYAFVRTARAARRRAALARLRRRGGSAPARLPVFTAPLTGGAQDAGIREIPIECIDGTLEPSRAAQFDGDFRPISGALRTRWQRIWMADARGEALPPIAVVPVGDCRYAVRDGHHRVSVARARGAVTIDATVGGA